MTVINGVNQVAAPRTAPARRVGQGGFSLPAEAAAAAPLSAVSAPGLLGLQEAESDAVRDRDARRHADEMLDALRDLQRALLDGASGGADRLAQLARRSTPAADPRLLDVQRALAVRAAVEAARRTG